MATHVVPGRVHMYIYLEHHVDKVVEAEQCPDQLLLAKTSFNSPLLTLLLKGVGDQNLE